MTVLAGQLDRPVTLWRFTESQGAGGELSRVWAKLTDGDVWAKIDPLTGDETLAAGAMQNIQTHRILIRYFPGLTTKDRIRGHNLVTNGTFDADSDWTLGAGWTIAAGKATYAGAGAAITQTLGTTTSASTLYDLTYTVSGRTAGTITPTFDGVAGTARSTNDTFTETVTGNGAMILLFTPTAAFDGSIDDVMVHGQRAYNVESIGEIGREVGMELGCAEAV